MEELKRCPFCGGTATAFKDNYDKCGVFCNHCNAMVGVKLECGTELVDGWNAEFSTTEQSVAAWNKRAGD